MTKEQLGKTIKNIGKELDKRGPEIAIGVGIIGMVIASVEAVKVTPKAIELIEDKKEELEKDELNAKEIIEASWKCYLVPVIVGTASITCVIGASQTNWKRKTALATAYTITETKLNDYQEKVVSLLGKGKDKEIKSEIAKDKVRENPIQNVIIMDGKGDTNCYDVISGRYFRSDKETIRKVVNDLNSRMLKDGYISLNEFYYELGLPENTVGDLLGWHLDRGQIDIDFSSQLDAADNPCLVIDYRVAPVYDFMY